MTEAELEVIRGFVERLIARTENECVWSLRNSVKYLLTSELEAMEQEAHQQDRGEAMEVAS